MNETIVSVRGVSKAFGAVRALQDVSLTVQQGMVTAIVGDNGSGKSTLIQLLSGNLAPDSGSITVGGQTYRRLQVRQALENGTYRLDTPVTIGMMVDYKAIYLVGEGNLHHDEQGFRLTGCDGKLCYTQSPLACYGLYSDYYWYEIGDVICIGNQDALYYCFPRRPDVVAKTRLAAEELYKLQKLRRRRPQTVPK